MAQYVNGPWKDIFSGKWAEYEVRLMENPDRITMTQIMDVRDGKTAGIITIINKYYMGTGNLTKLAEQLEDRALIFEKHYPDFSASYFCLSSGPQYSPVDNVDKAIEEQFEKIEQLSETMNEKSKVLNTELIEMKNADEQLWEKLFAEQLILPNLLIPGQSGKAPSRQSTGTSMIGTRITGELAEEKTQSFLKTVSFGTEEERTGLLKIIAENCVLNGVTVIAFDEKDTFTNMSVPNKDFDFKNYQGLQPIGMPVKTLKPGEAKIDLNLLTKDMFREIIGVESKEKEYLGKTAAELIDEMIEKHRGEFKKIDDLEEKLLTVTAEAKKFHIYKAIRWIRVLKLAYPDYFSGKTSTNEIASQYMKTMGSITRIELANTEQNLRRAFVYSIVKSLSENNKEQGYGNEIKMIALMPQADKYAPKEPKTALQKGTLEALSLGAENGVGYCLCAETEEEIYRDAVETASMRVDFVGKNEIAVKAENERAYRAKIRPRLSS